MVGLFGCDNTTFVSGFRIGDGRVVPRFLLEHTADGRGAEMQTCPGEHLGDLDLAQCGAKNFETMHDVVDEYRELVDRLGQLHERIKPVFIEPSHP